MHSSLTVISLAGSTNTRPSRAATMPEYAGLVAGISIPDQSISGERPLTTMRIRRVCNSSSPGFTGVGSQNFLTTITDPSGRRISNEYSSGTPAAKPPSGSMTDCTCGAKGTGIIIMLSPIVTWWVGCS